MDTLFQKPITVITGHYGCGKTSLSLNLAMSGKYKSIIDLDVVNPFFRSSDYRKMIEDKGVKVIAPYFAGTNLDVPFIPKDVKTSVMFDEKVLIDAGGDDQGAVATGTISNEIKKRGYDLVYVVNFMRPQTRIAEDAFDIMKEIESACHLYVTGIVNNTNLKQETTQEVIDYGVDRTRELARMAGLPILFHVQEKAFSYIIKGTSEKVVKTESYVLTPWEQA